jgi:hypothetical protein
MQLPLSFAQESSDPAEPSPTVWSTLEANQRNETLAVLARLLAKTVKASPNADAAVTEKRGNHD